MLADSRAMEEEAERYNPVNPTAMSHYSKEKRQNKKGSGATPSMGLSQFRGGDYECVSGGAMENPRTEVKGLAHRRAEHLEAMRQKSSNPKELLNNRFENTNRLVGQGATPSMGLSQFRGGKHTLIDHLEHPTKGYGKKKMEEEKCEESSSDEEDHAEAHGLGRHLRDHLMEIHGKGYTKSFSRGMGGLEAARVRVADALAGSGVSETQRASMIKSKAMPGRNRNEGVPLLSGNIDGVWSGTGKACMPKRGRGRPRKAKGGDMLTAPMPIPATNLSLTGTKNMADNVEPQMPPKEQSGKVNRKVAEERKVVEEGSGMTGAYEGQGRMVGGAKPDGRKKRAEIVKKIMKEKGLKMIEASKYVKEHKLY